jgi:surface antigen
MRGAWPAPLLALLVAVASVAATSVAALVSTDGPAAAAATSELCDGYAACSLSPYSTHGYQYDSATSHWGMAPGDECTNYAAFVEATFFGVPAPDYPLGNAGAWATNARDHGITVNSTPSVGSVAQWNAGSFGIGPLGHVAVVEAVGPHVIEVSQQDVSTDMDGYDWQQIDAGAPVDVWEPWPDNFIHFPTSTSGSTRSGAPRSLPSPVIGMASAPAGSGYWLADAQGEVSAHGDVINYGSLAGHPLDAPIDRIVSTPSGNGYWLVAADGGMFSFGDARFFGSMGGRQLDAPVVDAAPTADGRGYWLVASDGGVFAFGDARFLGSMGGRRLNKPIVGLSADDATGGYWLVAADGGIFSGGAPFFGSTGSVHLNKPVNGMTATSTGGGYWLVASDGGLFNGGDARFLGSTASLGLNAPIVGMAADPRTGGYWLVAADGGVFSFGAPFLGAD